jgi:hypothetical protein
MLLEVFLDENKIKALHPRMFNPQTNFNRLRELDLRRNICIDRVFRQSCWFGNCKPVDPENDLEECGKNYA